MVLVEGVLRPDEVGTSWSGPPQTGTLGPGPECHRIPVEEGYPDQCYPFAPTEEGIGRPSGTIG